MIAAFSESLSLPVTSFDVAVSASQWRARLVRRTQCSAVALILLRRTVITCGVRCTPVTGHHWTPYHPPQASERQTTQLATVAYINFEVCPTHGCGDSAGAWRRMCLKMLDSTGPSSTMNRTTDSRLLCITVMKWVTRPLIGAWQQQHTRLQTPRFSDHSTMHRYICGDSFGRACWSS